MIIVRDGIEAAIRLFKREVGKDGILRELKNKRHYEKPSVKRKRKQREAKRRRNKEAARNERRGKYNKGRV